MFETPILFIIYNRPDTTHYVFETLRKIQPKKLYIFADGPNMSSQSDITLCLQTRAVPFISWDCEVKWWKVPENMGVRKGVSAAIDWFFQQEDEGIILNDDCLPDMSFFPYCAEMLERYRDNERIFSISGSCYDRKHITDDSYYFSRFCYTWGWATWKRAWKHYDKDLLDFPDQRHTGFIKKIFQQPYIQLYWIRRFETLYNDRRINMYVLQWMYAMWKMNALAITPTTNLITKMTSNKELNTLVNKSIAHIKTEPLQFPLKHPEVIEPNRKADTRILQRLARLSLSEAITFRRLAHKLSKAEIKFLKSNSTKSTPTE